MSDREWVSRTYGDPYLQLSCDCGWVGRDADITDWVVQDERDRVLRQCPGCEEPVPEWGAFRPIDALADHAHGSLAEALDRN